MFLPSSFLRISRFGALRAVVAVLAVFLLILPRAAQAKRHFHPSAYHVIKAVNQGSQTVTVGTAHSKDHSEKAFKINQFTEITVDGSKATLHDLRPGMMVDINELADNVAAAIDAKHHNKH